MDNYPDYDSIYTNISDINTADKNPLDNSRIARYDNINEFQNAPLNNLININPQNIISMKQF